MTAERFQCLLRSEVRLVDLDTGAHGVLDKTDRWFNDVDASGPVGIARVIEAFNDGGDPVRWRRAGTDVGRDQRFNGPDRFVSGLSFSPDGRRLVGVGGDHRGSVWDVGPP